MVEHPLGRTCLQDEHAQAVRDDVVQLACDPPPLLLDRRQLPRLLLGLQRLRPRLPRPHREPDEHNQPQHRRVIDRVAERLDPRIAEIMGRDAGNGQRHRDHRPRRVRGRGVDGDDDHEEVAGRIGAAVGDRLQQRRHHRNRKHRERTRPPPDERNRDAADQQPVEGARAVPAASDRHVDLRDDEQQGRKRHVGQPRAREAPNFERNGQLHNRDGSRETRATTSAPRPISNTPRG